ncbi:MAG: alpha/beta hydrolase fold domain-containing protein [Aeromicrobium sp.]
MDEYAPGRRIIARGTPDRGIALLWHGRGVDGAHWMLPLVERVAAAGVMALSADWNSEAVDHGRTDLLSSLRFARDIAERHDRDPDSVAVAGWSLGGTAAASLAVHAKRLGVSLGGAVLIAPGDGPRAIDAISGSALPATMPPGSGRCGIDLVYGDRDTSATPDLVAGLELRLRSAGWRTRLHEIDTDHAGIVGARFDERTEQYPPATATHALHAADAVAEVIVEAASPSPSSS